MMQCTELNNCCLRPMKGTVSGYEMQLHFQEFIISKGSSKWVQEVACAVLHSAGYIHCTSRCFIVTIVTKLSNAFGSKQLETVVKL